MNSVTVVVIIVITVINDNISSLLERFKSFFKDKRKDEVNVEYSEYHPHKALHRGLKFLFY